MLVQPPVNNDLLNSSTRPKRNTVIQYALADDTINKAEVLSIQPKRDGVHGDWVNVRRFGENDSSSVDWRQILWRRIMWNKYLC